MDKCVDCGALVDTDDEPEAYTVELEDGSELPTESCRCEDCRTDFGAQAVTEEA